MNRWSVRTLFAMLQALAVVCALPACAADADSTGMDWSRVPEYRLVPGDLVNLNFGPRPDNSSDLVRSARVRIDGRISVFPVGEVIAAGRTPRELEQALLALLAPDFRNPRLTVEVAELAGNRVHVLGEVGAPQSVPATPFMTVLQAITSAGGFKNDAARNSVLLFRRDGARNVRVMRLRLDRAIKSGDLGEDLLVGRFDIVYVPRSTIGNVGLFCQQFLDGPQRILSTAFTGWELFNLDRVFVVPSSH